MGDFPFALALLDAMFPSDPRRNWREFSACVSADQIAALPHISEVEGALVSRYRNPTAVGCECLESHLINKPKLNEFCMSAITHYFAHVSI
jgi:hypothetical protein